MGLLRSGWRPVAGEVEVVIMKNVLSRSSYLFAVSFAVALGASQSAFGATCLETTTSYGTTVTDYVAASVTGYVPGTCQIGSTNNDNLGGGVYALNTDSIGGFSVWTLIGKIEVAKPAVDGMLTSDDTNQYLTIDGTGAATYGDGSGTTTDFLGTWSIDSNAYSIYGLIALVFKDGSGIPDQYITYLTNIGNFFGDFRSPYKETSGILKDVSHFAIYGVMVNDCASSPVCNPQAPIPLPAAFPLFASGLGVLGLLGWRRRRKSAA